MKNLLIILFILTSGLSFAQDLSNKTIKELKNLKTQAISNKNYELAGKVNNEIKKREKNNVSITKIESNLKNELSIALKNEDYEQAALIKKKLLKVDEYKSIDEAVKEEDYAVAGELKASKIQLLKEISTEIPSISKPKYTDNTNQSNQTSTNTGGGTGQFMFILGDLSKLSLYYDVMIDDKFYGTISGEQTIIVKNIPAGDHNVCVVYDLKYKHNVSFVVENNVSKKITVNYVAKNNQAKFSDFYSIVTISESQIPEYSQKVDYKDGSLVDMSNIQTQSLSNNRSSNVSGKENPTGVYLYETTQFGIGGLFGGQILPLKYQTMTPIIKDIGISWGWGGAIAFSSDFDIYYNATGMIGYKYETDHYSPYITYNLGIGAFNTNYFVVSTLNLGAEFFLSTLGQNGIGLYTEWNYGLFVGGGYSFTLGLVWRPRIPAV